MPLHTLRKCFAPTTGRIPQCLADPKNTPITCFDQVAITTELTDMRNALASAQAMQTKASGSIDLVSVTRPGST